MADVRLTATNPADSSVVPVACNARGELLLEEPLEVEGPPGPKGDKGDPGEPGKDGDPFTGNFVGPVSFSGSATFSEDVVINDIKVGKGGGNQGGCTAVGSFALNLNTTGTGNTAVGAGALQQNTDGIANTAVGRDALQENSAGESNTAIGNGALSLNTVGGANTAVGRAALQKNSAGESNTAIGRSTLQENTVGGANTAVGRLALQINTTGEGNTAVGFGALVANVVGNNNTVIGKQSGYQLTGSFNTFIGNYGGAAGLSNTLSLSTGSTERMRIASDDAVDFNQKCGFTADGGLWITDTRGNKWRTTFGSNEFMQWEAYEVALRNEPQLIDPESA